ncbi:MAG: hypothetical protein KJ007_08580 [Burkholderiales bacterium]|nr:hypothetical protein [Burkholderiales bacterium]
MAATRWKTRDCIRPYAPRGWKIPYAGYRGEANASDPEPAAGPESAGIGEIPADEGCHIIIIQEQKRPSAQDSSP